MLFIKDMIILLLNWFVDSKNWTSNIEKHLYILQFLKTCQEFKVTKFLQFHVASDSRRQSQTHQTCKKRLLLEEIRIKRNKRRW